MRSNEIIHFELNKFISHGRYELNKLTSLPMCGFIAQLVEQRTGNAEVTGSNPVKALIFFRLLLSNCLNWKIYCDDHYSLSVTILCTHSVVSGQGRMIPSCSVLSSSFLSSGIMLCGTA